MLEINKIYNEDCIEGMKKLDDCCVDLVVTDPPYLISYKTNYRNNKKHKFCSAIKNDDNFELISNYIKELHRIMKNNTAGYMFCNAGKIDFFKQCIEKHSKKDGLIFDGFVGSGTTALACKELNRNFIGFELDKEYFEITRKRIKEYLNQKRVGI